MLEKGLRLTQTQVKKVLDFWKPFFSYGVVLNYMQNAETHNRFAIVISWKSTSWWVERNYFRRQFYTLVSPYIERKSKNNFFDLVFVVKKSTLLEKRDVQITEKFSQDIGFLLKKMFD